jgi:hypothetical protein
MEYGEGAEECRGQTGEGRNAFCLRPTCSFGTSETRNRHSSSKPAPLFFLDTMF